MGFRCGIVGLPNVGKSTLFNALTRTAAAQAANYPFCTIEPNTGEVAVPDPRLDALAAIAKPAQIVPTRISFVDIAGLVRGASKGEGLGNQFLANIREVDAVVHVLRCFEGTDVTHVEGRIDPVADAETVNTELMLADLAEPRAARLAAPQAGAIRRQGSQGRGGADGRRDRASLATASRRGWSTCRKGEEALFRGFNLLTAKPILYVANVEEAAAATGNQHSEAVAAMAKAEGAGFVVDLGRDRGGDRAAARRRGARIPGDHGAGGARPRPADPRRLRPARPHHLLHRRPEGSARLDDPARARTRRRRPARIHTDFEKGFIRAQTIAYDDYIKLGGEHGGQGGRQGARGRQGLRRPGRRRDALQVQRVRPARRDQAKPAPCSAKSGGTIANHAVR